MLRQDYFMQGLDPSNYAFSFGVDLGGWKGLSAYKNDSNYWFKLFKANYRSYEITWNSQDVSKGWQGKLILDDDSTGRFLKIIFNFVENSWWNKKNHQYDNLKNNFV